MVGIEVRILSIQGDAVVSARPKLVGDIWIKGIMANYATSHRVFITKYIWCRKADLKPTVCLAVKSGNENKTLIIESMTLIYTEQLLTTAKKTGNMITKDWADNHLFIKIPRGFVYGLCAPSLENPLTNMNDIWVRVDCRMIESKQKYTKASVPNPFKLTQEIDIIAAVCVAGVALHVNFIRLPPASGELPFLIPSLRMVSAHIFARFLFELGYDPALKCAVGENVHAQDQGFPDAMVEALDLMVSKTTIKSLSNMQLGVREALAKCCWVLGG